MDGRGLGRDEKKPTTDSFVIFEDMPVSPATEKVIGQFKLCAQNGVKDLAINCCFIYMNKKLGNTTLYSQNIFPDVSAMLPSSGGQN